MVAGLKGMSHMSRLRQSKARYVLPQYKLVSRGYLMMLGKRGKLTSLDEWTYYRRKVQYDVCYCQACELVRFLRRHCCESPKLASQEHEVTDPVSVECLDQGASVGLVFIVHDDHHA